jgi:hypothetical protein
VCFALAGCSDDSPEAANARRDAPLADHASAQDIANPKRPVAVMSQVEFLSESVATWLHGLGDKVLIRDFAGMEAYFGSDFAGHDLFATKVLVEEQLPVGARKFNRDVAGAKRVDRGEFLDSLEVAIGPWQRVEQSKFKVVKAEFERGQPPPWGKLLLRCKIVGVTENGGRETHKFRAVVRVVRNADTWSLQRLQVTDMESRSTSVPLFTDVTRATGVAHEGVRFGKPGNDTDAWNGAAACDVDGDGRIDVFVPSSTGYFLYMNRGDGRFQDEAVARGLAGTGGGTGAVFFDYDNDGDQDLAVAHVGWRDIDRNLQGTPLQLFANDGEGRFVSVAKDVGLDVLRVGFSWTVLDYDQDGWLDLFLCGYGRIEEERNNSWLEASNGSRNSLFRNEGGKRFVDVTDAARIDGTSWSYASAAADYDQDGHVDLYIANNFGSNQLYRNLGDGTFEDVAKELGLTERGNSMGASWGDFDGDGRLDLYVSNPASTVGKRILERMRGRASNAVLEDLFRMASGNTLFLSRGDRFERAADDYGGRGANWAWSSSLADFDLDGALDIFCVNGFVTGDLPQDT